MLLGLVFPDMNARSLRGPLLIVLVSVALLLPCFWHSRIQAGDLSSHLYNAWLGTEILAGRAAGLDLVTPSTNFLFDRMLLWLMQSGGPALAEHIAVPLAVLVLFWGGLMWIRVAAGFVPWALVPCLAMLAYGWVFHNGFFNFYLATGLTFWALSLAWKPTPLRLGGALLLFGVAYLAHALPVLWGCAALLYVLVWRRIPEDRSIWLAVSSCGAIGALRLVLDAKYKTLSTSHQLLEMVGIDQFWVFGPKYIGISLALAFIWAFLLLSLSHEKGLIRSLPLQLCAVMSFAVLILPTRVELSGYRMALSFITERMTLPFGFLVCLLLSRARPMAWQRWALVIIAGVYFSFLYVDTRALNHWEDKAAAAVEQLPRGARVVSAMQDWSSRTMLWQFPAERACIGRCFSYQNYEAGSLAFQVVARHRNPYVMHSSNDAAHVRTGEYVVKPDDLQLHQLTLCSDGGLCALPLKPGQTVKVDELSMLPALF